MTGSNSVTFIHNSEVYGFSFTLDYYNMLVCHFVPSKGPETNSKKVQIVLDG